jgi:hypothetical protein
MAVCPTALALHVWGEEGEGDKRKERIGEEKGELVAAERWAGGNSSPSPASMPAMDPIHLPPPHCM